MEENKSIPDKETLRQQLQIQWQDHIQTREQTCKTLQIEAVLILGMIGADLKFDNILILGIISIILLTSALLGIAVTIHHRKVQIQKFKFIYKIEKALGLHHKDLLGHDVSEPKEFSWKRILDFKRIATPTFILLMHIAIFSFTVLYVFTRIYLTLWNP